VQHYIRHDLSQDRILGNLLGTAHQGLMIVDADLRLVLANETAVRLLGLPADLVAAMPTLADLLRFAAKRGDLGPGDPQAHVEAGLARVRARRPFDFERRDHSGTVLRVQGTPTQDGGFVTFYSDITEARRHEDAAEEARHVLEHRLEERSAELRRGRDLLFNAVNAVRDGLAIVDECGTIVLANGTFKRLFKTPERPELEGANILEVFETAGPPGLAEALEGLETDPEIPCEFRFGRDTWYRVSRRPVGADGTLTYKLTDVTAFKKQHRVLQRHADKLVKLLRNEQKINELQREFVSMASHEFRTPLAIIASNAQRLQRRLDKAQAEAHTPAVDAETLTARLGNIRQSVDRMQYLINRFLSFSQGQSGMLEISPVRTPLRQLVEAVCEHRQKVCETHRLDLDIAELPEMATIDAKLIEQSLDNLISNAVKYSPGQERVRIHGFTDGRFAVLRIEDTGVGIPKKEIPKIFRRYYRASTASGIPGTGIGLHMTDMIVSGHGGRLNVYSEVGKATTVEIRIPHTRSEETGEPAPPTPPENRPVEKEVAQ